MNNPAMPWAITSLVLFATGHWIGGIVGFLATIAALVGED